MRSVLDTQRQTSGACYPRTPSARLWRRAGMVRRTRPTTIIIIIIIIIIIVIMCIVIIISIIITIMFIITVVIRTRPTTSPGRRAA